jgi:sugar phosphate isomerase/epimerase
MSHNPSRMSPALTRRELGAFALAAIGLPFIRRAEAFARRSAGALDPAVRDGVRLGVQTYSFRALPRTPDGDAVGPVLSAIRECGFIECELHAPQVEPELSGPRAREALRRWRLETSLDHFREVGKRFVAAGVAIYAYNYSFERDFTDAEVDRGFEMAKALGARIITASTTLDMAKRVVPFAERHQMVLAVHGYSNVNDPNGFATPESFAAALKMSKYYKVNLDIGHFTAANYDAAAYIKEHHSDITNLHLKDRRRNQGDNVPWGTGDTPIREVLQLLKQHGWPIGAYVEYEYPGAAGPVDEVKKCYAYARKAVA